MTDDDLYFYIDQVYSRYPNYDHIKIANKLYIEEKKVVSAQTVFNILKNIKSEKKVHDHNFSKRTNSINIKPQHNPKWHHDEVILALDLYFDLRPNNLNAKNPRIIELSKFLNKLPLHGSHNVSVEFRNPNGVALKLANFLFLDNDYPGKGMSSYSKLDKQLFNRYKFNRNHLRKDAQSIRDSFEKQNKGNGNVKYESSKEIENISTNLLISDIFSDNLYKLFVKFCDKKGFKYLADLRDFNFNTLYKIPGLGVKKISNILAIYEKYNEEEFKKSQPDPNEIIANYPVSDETIIHLPLFSNFEASYKEYHESYRINDPITNLNLKPRALHAIENSNLRTILDLMNCKPDELIKLKNCGKTTIKEFQSSIRQYLLQKDQDLSSKWDSFDSMIKSIIKIKDRNLQIFKNRLGIDHDEPLTLEESGEEFEITRERTRQILNSYNAPKIRTVV